MPKRKLNIKIKNINEAISYQVQAIVTDTEIKYQEKDKTIVKYNLETDTIIRENNELRMEYQFNTKKKTNGQIYIKDLGKSLEVKIQTKKLQKENNNIDINYFIDKEEFIYQMEEIK